MIQPEATHQIHVPQGPCLARKFVLQPANCNARPARLAARPGPRAAQAAGMALSKLSLLRARGPAAGAAAGPRRSAAARPERPRSRARAPAALPQQQTAAEARQRLLDNYWEARARVHGTRRHARGALPPRGAAVASALRRWRCGA